jgi:O-antigen ligase
MTDTSRPLERDPGPLAALPAVPPSLIVAAALLCASMLGFLLADQHVTYGLGIVLISCYAPLVFLNFRIALAIWVAMLFFDGLSAFSHAPNTVGVLIALGWLGSFIGRREAHPPLREHRRLLLAIVVFAVWLTVTVAWSTKPSASVGETGNWWLGALVFLIILTSIRSISDVRLIALAFLFGAIVSVIIGVAAGGLGSTSVSSQTAISGRLTGGGTDPNEQAARYLAAMFLITGLSSIYRRPSARAGLLFGLLVVAVGFFATQSRGGLVALGVATLAALILAPEQRRRLAALAATMVFACVILLAVQPSALSRITDISGGTSGRGDLWRVAWQVFEGHPLIGVGTGNFEVVEAHSHYVLRPGSINRIQYLAETPEVAHNTYLQLLAETGVPGLIAFLVVIGGVIRSYMLACARFAALGRSDLVDLTRTALMGTIGFLTAIFFITDGWAYELWIMMALGPALLGIATRMRAAVPELSSFTAVGRPQPRGGLPSSGSRAAI